MGEIFKQRKESYFILSKEIIEYGDEAADVKEIAVELKIDYNSMTCSISRFDKESLGTKSERGFFFEGINTWQIKESLALAALIDEAIKLAYKELRGKK